MPGDGDVGVRDAPQRSRFEVLVDGAVAGFAAYELRPGEPDVLVLTHTEVEHEGAGLGSTLVRGLLDDVRRRGALVVARCPFVAAFIERHPEQADLLAPSPRG